MNTLVLLSMVLLGQNYAPSREGLAPLDAAREERVQRLGKQLRCAVCQGVAISDSPASMARAQLDKVRELVAEGKNDEEILNYFVTRYGEWVLLEPTKTGLNSVLWVGPLVLLGLGLVLIVLQTAKQKPAVAASSPAPAPAALSEDELLAQVRADVEKA
jgi:cytochrome c-type biogenesis protein CcmH